MVSHASPYAQRAWIALELHKQAGALQYELQHVDLRNKPDWHKDAYATAVGRNPNSDGKVPTLVTAEGVTMAESAVIAKYVDDKYAAASGVSLDASSPLERARVQLFWEQTTEPLTKVFGAALFAPPDARAAALESVTEAIKSVGQALLAHDETLDAAHKGAFFLGDQLGFAEVMVWPWLHRMSALVALTGYEVPAASQDDAFARFHEWTAAIAAHPVVSATHKEDDAEFFTAVFKAVLQRVTAAAAKAETKVQ